MIMRTWRATVDPERADEYERFARERSLPMFRGQPGYLGVLMARDGSDAIVVTFWRGMADVERLRSSPSYMQAVEDIVAAGFLRGESGTAVRTVHLSELPASD